VLRRIFGPEGDEEKRDWRKLHNKEIHNLYCSKNIITVLKSRVMRWAGHIAHMGRRGLRTGFWWERQKERDH
jgi:hypothetical protein